MTSDFQDGKIVTVQTAKSEKQKSTKVSVAVRILFIKNLPTASRLIPNLIPKFAVHP